MNRKKKIEENLLLLKNKSRKKQLKKFYLWLFLGIPLIFWVFYCLWLTIFYVFSNGRDSIYLDALKILFWIIGFSIWVVGLYRYSLKIFQIPVNIKKMFSTISNLWVNVFRKPKSTAHEKQKDLIINTSYWIAVILPPLITSIVSLYIYNQSFESYKAKVDKRAAEEVLSSWVETNDYFPSTVTWSTVINGPLPNMTFELIPNGSFWMGTNDEDAGDFDEQPKRYVHIRAFYLMTTEVTIEMFNLFVDSSGYETYGEKHDSIWVHEYEYIGKTDRKIVGGHWEVFDTWRSDTISVNRPVAYVTWNDTQEFIKWLNDIDPSRIYRLPTESEWEYACRAGSNALFSSGSTIKKFKEIAWYSRNTDYLNEVAAKEPNRWGLYDMHGNVWEWCEDWYHESYRGAPIDDSSVRFPTQSKVIRGGSYQSAKAYYCRSANRHHADPDAYSQDLGFRVVMLDPRRGISTLSEPVINRVR